MALQVDDGQHARLGLESQHPLVRCLILPRARADKRRASEINTLMAVNVTGDEDIRNVPDHQTILGFGR